MSSFADRPPPDPQHFLKALEEWKAGDATPGTTLQTFKRGGLDELLVANVDTDSELAVAWSNWERGRVLPADTIVALESAGLRGLLERIIAAQREVFGGA